MRLDYDVRATIVDVLTLIRRFAMSGDYTLEKLGGRFYVRAGESVNALELAKLVQSGLAEQARVMPPFTTTVLQERAPEVAAKLVDDPAVVTAATEAFREVAQVQRAGELPTTVERTTADFAAW